MFLEGALQFWMGGRLNHLRQRFEDLVFRVVNVLQLVNQKVVQGIELCHGGLLAYAGAVWQRSSRVLAGVCESSVAATNVRIASKMEPCSASPSSSAA